MGIVLFMAMLVTPAATAYLLARLFVSMMMVAAGTDLYISYYFDLPTSPAMTLVARGIFILVVSFRRRVPT